MENDKAYIVGLLGIKGLGPQKLRKMKRELGSYQAIWEAPTNWLMERVGAEIAGEIFELRRTSDPEDQLSKIQAAGFMVWADYEEEYPSRLKEIHVPPLLLFGRGRYETLQKQAIAIVGSRRATTYGRKVARRLGRELAEAGLVVISGMARGIDSESHLGCLEGQGLTIGVLGNGLDVVYPRENQQLYSRVVEQGLLVTEFFPGTKPEARNFPIRNRIISGLCSALVVVEAEGKSGAMITVDFALEQGREVMAVPGPITSPFSQGTNQLIKEGARLVSRVEDIMEEMGLDFGTRPSGSSQQQEEADSLIEHIGFEPIHIDQLLVLSNLSYGPLAARLLKLEIEGQITSLPGNMYVRV